MTPEELVTRLRAAGCVYAEDEAELLLTTATGPDDLERLTAARCEGAPLETLVGFVEFGGLRLHVAPGTFVPRQRTVELARAAAAACRPGALVVDLCCGVGAVGALISAMVPVRLVAVDIDPAEVACAASNLPEATTLTGDLFDPVDPALAGSVDVVVCNAPYVPSGQVSAMPREAREHEPLVALDGGDDGLAVQRRVVAQAPAWLRSGGALLIETSEGQAPDLVAAYGAAGLEARVIRRQGAVVVHGTMPA